MQSAWARMTRKPLRGLAFAALAAVLMADWILFSNCILPSQRGGPTVLADGLRSNSFQAQASLASGGLSYAGRFGLGQGWEMGIRPSAGFIYFGGDIDVKKHLLEINSFHLSGGLALAAYFPGDPGPYTRLIPELTLGHPNFWLSIRNPWLISAWEEEDGPVPFLGGAVGFQFGSRWRLAGEVGADIELAEYGGEYTGNFTYPFGGLAVFYHFGDPPVAE